MTNNYRIEGNIVYIEIKYKDLILETLIDLEDFDLVNSYIGTWIAWYSKSNNTFYCRLKNNYLHRIIMNVTNSKIHIDHIYHNTLDNRKSELRLVTFQENMWNGKNTKGYTFDKITQKWDSNIMVNRKKKYLGSFNTEEEAKQSYLKAKEFYHIIGENKKSDEEILEFEKSIKKEPKGYCWREKNKKYIARIKINGKTIHLGCFEKEENAKNAYLEAKEKYKGDK